MTTNGQICKMSYTTYCNTYCNMGQPYCNVLQYAFCHIVSPLQGSVWELTLQQTCQCFNSFPNDKILDQTKLKAFADDKFNVTKMIIAVFDGVENIVEKGEMACASNFSFS